METEINRVVAFILGLCFSVISYGQEKQTDQDVWQVGIAREVITPTKSMWMAGYANRTAPSDGKIHDLWAKALTLKDARGHTSLLITMDILSIPVDFSHRIKSELKRTYGLEPSQIILNASHTHSGPVLSNALKYIYPMDEAQWKEVTEYTRVLEQRILRLAENSMRELQPAYVYTGNGITRFQVNRRNNDASKLTATTVLNGPNDYAVPVIKIESADKQIRAIVFGYACHPTVLSGYQFSGDYVGFAQIELEKMYPGATAMFFQGAGADQNPLPRHLVSLAVQYGKQLAVAVEQVLSEKMTKQKSMLKTLYKEIELPFDRPMTMEQFQELAKGSDFHARWARGMMAEYKEKGSFSKSYAYPIAYWKLGNQSLFALGGELVVAYAVKLKELFGQDIFVMGYANDVMGYIPSTVILEEGRYEGDTAPRVYGLPAKWGKQTESLIMENCKQIAQEEIRE